MTDARHFAPGVAAGNDADSKLGGFPSLAERELADTITTLGPVGLQERRRQTARYVQDDGITYGATPDGRQGRNWTIDPLPFIIDAPDWRVLEAGLKQRSQVLDLLLADIYGERKVVAEGLVAPEILAAHPGFLRQVDGIRLPGPHQLAHLATDLGRTSDGTWVAYSDRAQAPSGAGYAMATRRITTRVMAGLHRDTALARLRTFFHTMAASLLDAAPENVEDPRIVLLSPGPESETAFDQAFFATLLGLPMVESPDLFMRDGVVMRNTTTGEEAVDVIVRRVDADWCDPLDLRGDSRLGVPGIVEATRRGTLSVVNPLGSGVLENPALTRLLPVLTRYFLGEDAKLATTPTYWCGDDAELSHVLANLDHLVVKPLARNGHPQPVFTEKLTASARAELAARIAAEPWLWCAQEFVSFTSSPVIGRHGVEQREVVLRTFAVGRGEEYQIMPGALGRVPRQLGELNISNATGALAKDVWVLVDEQAASPEAPQRRLREVLALHEGAGLSTRMAGNLFWLGRYAERTEATSRLLRVVADVTEDHARRPGSQGFVAMSALLVATSQVLNLRPGFSPATPEAFTTPYPELRRALLDADAEGTVAFASRRLIGVAQSVREILSLDTWLVLARLERTLATEFTDDQPLQPIFAQIQEVMLAFAGIMAQNMIRDASWAYIEIGSRLERAQHTVSLLRASLLANRSPNTEAMITEAVLTAGESIITHRRRLAGGAGPLQLAESTLDLLLLDSSNPRSVAYQLARLADAFEMVGALEQAERSRLLFAQLGAVDPSGMGEADRSALADLTASILTEVRELAANFERQHLTSVSLLQTQQSEWGLVTTYPSDHAAVDQGESESDEELS